MVYSYEEHKHRCPGLHLIFSNEEAKKRQDHFYLCSTILLNHKWFRNKSELSHVVLLQAGDTGWSFTSMLTRVPGNGCHGNHFMKEVTLGTLVHNADNIIYTWQWCNLYKVGKYDYICADPNNGVWINLINLMIYYPYTMTFCLRSYLTFM